MKKENLYGWTILVPALALIASPALAGELAFEYEHVADIGGRTAIGDVDGDGKNDIVVHTWSSDRGIGADGSISWYKYPNWKKTFILQNNHLFGDGVILTDLDGDGDNDIVSAAWDYPELLHLWRNDALKSGKQ